MLSDLFFQVSLVICCTLFLSAHYASGSTGQANTAKHVNLFTTAEISKIYDTEGTSDSGGDNSITPTDFYSPFLVATDDVIVALAGVNSTSSSENEHINVLARHIKPENDWISKISEEKWQKQFAVKKDWKDKTKLKFILAAAQKNNIYLLLVNDTAQGGGDGSDTPTQCDYCFFTGTFDEKTEGKIKWEDKAPLTDINKLKQQLTSKNLNNIPSNGYVLFEEKEKLLFALEFDKKSGNKKNGFAFVQLKEAERTVDFAEFDATDVTLFKLFLWKTKIMMAKYCGEKGSSIQQLQDKDGAKEWENTKEPIFRLVYHFENKNNFTAVLIKNANVLLFTQEKKKTAVDSTQKTSCVDLWMTDGSRSYNVGPIVTNEKEITFAGLLHTQGHLFSLHKQTENAQTKIVFKHLDEKLKKINATLEQWKNNNKEIKTLCKTTSTSLQTTCPTDGLVGFLSSDIDKEKKQWIDKYLNINATIHASSEVQINDNNEITFSRAGAGAVWPMSEETKEQPYNFKKFGSTLVATVKINGNKNKKENSILGIALKEGASSSKKRISLWCSSEQKWAVSKGVEFTNLVSINKNCEQDESYLVVLRLNKESDKLKVYIDGHKLEIAQKETVTIANEDTISHFYFGADKEDQNTVETQVSIKNVLLYNRPLNQSEIDGFKISEKKKVTNPEETDSGNNTSGQQSDNNLDENKGVSTDNNRTEDKQSPSPPPTTEDSAARVGVVGVLCFMLFGVFTLLGRHVY